MAGVVVKTNGPYLAKTGKIQGRKYIIEYYEDGSNRKLLYSRYLVEQNIGRQLLPKEEVDHINRDKTDDRLENLKITAKDKHAALDHIKVKTVEIVCALCGNTAQRNARHMHHNAKQGKAGPFCSKSCAGKYSRAVQMGSIGRLPVQDEVPIEDREYFYADK